MTSTTDLVVNFLSKLAHGRGRFCIQERTGIEWVAMLEGVKLICE